MSKDNHVSLTLRLLEGERVQVGLGPAVATAAANASGAGGTEAADADAADAASWEHSSPASPLAAPSTPPPHGRLCAPLQRQEAPGQEERDGAGEGAGQEHEGEHVGLAGEGRVQEGPPQLGDGMAQQVEEGPPPPPPMPAGAQALAPAGSLWEEAREVQAAVQHAVAATVGSALSNLLLALIWAALFAKRTAARTLASAANFTTAAWHGLAAATATPCRATAAAWQRAWTALKVATGNASYQALKVWEWLIKPVANMPEVNHGQLLLGVALALLAAYTAGVSQAKHTPARLADEASVVPAHLPDSAAPPCVCAGLASSTGTQGTPATAPFTGSQHAAAPHGAAESGTAVQSGYARAGAATSHIPPELSSPDGASPASRPAEAAAGGKSSQAAPTSAPAAPASLSPTSNPSDSHKADSHLAQPSLLRAGRDLSNTARALAERYWQVLAQYWQVLLARYWQVLLARPVMSVAFTLLPVLAWVYYRAPDAAEAAWIQAKGAWQRARG